MKPSMAIAIGLAAAPLLLGACGTASPTPSSAPASHAAGPNPAPPVDDAPASNNSALNEPASAAPTFVPRDVPPGFREDGDLSEWGPLDANSIAIAVDATGLVIAMPERPAAPAYIAIAAEGTEPPDIGWSARGGHTHPLNEERCHFEQWYVHEGGGWKNGDPHPPEVVDACLALLERHRAFAARHRAQFVRALTLAPDGAVTLDSVVTADSTVASDSTAAPDNGAERIGQAHLGELGLEVRLPLTALPQLAEAPLKRLYALRSDQPLSAIPNIESLQEIPLPTPVHFGSLAALRERVMGEHAQWRVTAFSYHPSTPDRVTAARPQTQRLSPLPSGSRAMNRTAVLEQELPLFDEIEALGSVRVGLVPSENPFLATLSPADASASSAVVATHDLAELRSAILRDGEIHIFAFHSGGTDWSAGGAYFLPHWQVVAVDAQGAMRDIADSDGWQQMQPEWDDLPVPFFDPAFTAFGLRGRLDGRAKTVTLRWDPAARRYRSTVFPNPSAGGIPPNAAPGPKPQ